jgi:hypothetical protein
MEQAGPRATITEYFAGLEDPRRFNRRHKLLDILVIAICGALCGADGWEEIELFGESKEEWLRRFLELPHGIPSDDTYRRVFAALDVEQFENCFMDWIEAVEGLTAGQVVAGDGKTLRRSHDRSADKKALQMVSLWASENGVVLGQRKVDDESNEITAVQVVGHVGDRGLYRDAGRDPLSNRDGEDHRRETSGLCLAGQGEPAATAGSDTRALRQPFRNALGDV